MAPRPLDDNDIAIIGMAGRFPGARNVAGFWRNLCAGVESIHFFSDQELDALGVAPKALREPNFVKARAMLDDVEYFDAEFFGYTPKEAEIMDPQHRVLLECAWEALEDSGYDPQCYSGAIGVYAGATVSTYLLLNLLSNPDVVHSLGPLQIHMGNAGDFLTTRLSYKLNLKGPSYLVECACSTSLVAVHVACQSLLNEECDLALAGGVSINVKQRRGYRYLGGGMESPDGHCRAFDANAQGTIFGSGAGVVVLKRLPEAWADRDHIYAVIKGSAINNDGSLKVGYTAPSVEGQARVIAEALAASSVDARTITYVETHGTGTSLGDPIEVQALTKAFRSSTQARGFCRLGSVKTNVGHLEAAAGAASLIKTALALRDGILPPSLHFERPNPEIDFESSPFYVNTRLAEWETNDTPRRAGVSSFGFGGTNAHVILEEAPPPERSSASRPWQLLVLSAKTETALEQATDNLAAHLKQSPDLNLADAAYTLHVGRAGFKQRRMLVCQRAAEALHMLEARDSQHLLTGIQASHPQPLTFMFPGPGAQYPNMGRELYATEPIFRAHVDRCAELLAPHLGLDLRAVLYPDTTNDQRPTTNDQRQGDKETRRQGDEGAEQSAIYNLQSAIGESAILHPPSSILDQTALAQPALFVVEYALAQLWMSWGVRPQAMIGDGIGEYVAACLAGVFSLDDAVSLVALRGRSMRALPPDVMLGADLAEGEESFAAEVRRVRLQPPRLPYLSTLSGTWMTAAEAADPSYWARHLRQPARFAEGIQALLQEPNRIWLEVGPGQTLAQLVKDHPAARSEQLILSSLPPPPAAQSEAAFVLTTLGKLWLAGIDVDWAAFYAREQRRRVPLPTYPFERQRYWIEARDQTAERQPLVTAGKNPDIAEWFYLPGWKRARLPTPLKADGAPHARPTWLVFVDSVGLGHALVERLQHDRQTVIRILVGERFIKAAEDVYHLNPERRDDYQALLAELRATNKLPGQIVHLWSVGANTAAPVDGEVFAQAQTLGFYSLLFLVQTWEQLLPAAPVRLSLIADGLHDLTGAETLRPEKATLLGICQIIPQEHPNIACRCVDVALSHAEWRANSRLIDQLLTEVELESAEVMVAYRGLQRWAPHYEATRLESVSEPVRWLREGGVYLITGGLDGVGYALAEHLARSIRARLIITDASALPRPEAWSDWLSAHTEQDATSGAIRRVQLLEALGAEVLICEADLAQRDQVQAAVDRGLARFGTLHGVIHAAAADVFTFIQETDTTAAARHFDLKAHGLINLEHALRDHDLDFCLLHASLATVLGGLGYTAYTAANHFLNAFARRHNQSSAFPWISVNWDVWQLDDAPQMRALNPDLAQLAIAPFEGGEALRRILAADIVDPLVVSTEALALRVARGAQKMAARGRPPAQEVERCTTLHPRPTLQNRYVAPATEHERRIAEIWQRALGFERVGVTDNFFELGGDSFVAMHVSAQLKKELNVDVPPVSFYEGLTVRSLARLLEQDQSPPDQQIAIQLEAREEKASRRREFQQQHRIRKGKLAEDASR
jgi:phthiocerol/phenolphthiocerol synthesis type-I polyketide synthase E